MDDEQKSAAKGSAVLRLMAGGYLLYLTAGLVKDILAGQVIYLPLILLAAAGFGIIGAALIITSCRYLYRNR